MPATRSNYKKGTALNKAKTDKERPPIEVTEQEDINYISDEVGNSEMLALAKEVADQVPEEERTADTWPVMVQGRLSLTVCKKQYGVSKEELCRRIQPPERFSQSSVCQYLRKGRQGSNVPKDLKFCKGKTNTSKFSILTEGEISDVVQDYIRILRDSGDLRTLVATVPEEDRLSFMRGLSCIIQGLKADSSSNLLSHGFSNELLRKLLTEMHLSMP